MSRNNLVERRIRFLIAGSLVALLAFSVRLVDVQAVRAQGIAAKVTNELTKKKILPAPRGTITDMKGSELARSVISYRVIVDQSIIANPAELAALAAPILGMNAAALTQQLTGTKRYVIISQSVTPTVWNRLTDTVKNYNENLKASKDGASQQLAGFFSERLYTREYPSGSLAASIIGFINQSGIGAAGLEYSQNTLLTGTNGEYLYESGRGAIIPGTQQITVEEKKGSSIKLTIDKDIQYVAMQAISEVVKSSHAKSGTVIVMDPKTGEVLAQATYPTYDPVNTKTTDPSKFKNPAVEDVYEPGSTGKVITYAAALEEKKISPLSVFTIPYSLKVSNHVFHDHEKHATQQLTATGALAVSSNTGAIQIGKLMSNETLYSYLTKFGIGSKTGTQLPGESGGLLSKVKDWSGTTAPTVAFGQGYSLTAMQATSVFATLANDGVRVSPTVIAGTSDASGNYTPSAKRSAVRVVSAETAKQMRLMMESVVSASGTAESAAIPGYRVAGKTGTAMRIDDSCSCYRGYTASFIGFAPADKPAYVVSVTIQAPQGIHWGGYLGGPVFKKVMSFVLQDKRIPPTLTQKTIFPLNEKDLKASQKP
ncbi:MAG: penicillin-binding protein 2 [Acidobacteria bacterium]|nr:penicillin-binding protein 2 [Acidobacteriota bacterium]